MTKFKKKINLVKKVILAAGSSKRYGEENKLVQIFQKKPIINHTIDALLEIFEPQELLVVVGHEHTKIVKLINNPSIKIVNNIDYEKGIGTSISCAVKQLENYIQGVMIIPADMPLLSKKDIKKIRRQIF